MTYTVTSPLVGQAIGEDIDVVSWAIRNDIEPSRTWEWDAYLAEIYRLAPLVGLNPDLLVAQSAHETDNWSSPWWAQRLNPAGIGITGDAAQNDASPTWTNGTDAARAQVVHMC